MTIATGDTLPEADFLVFGDDGPGKVALGPKLKGRKVVIFGLPGAYTRTCTAAHLPSFIAVMDDLKAKGVDEVICVAVNDPFVMKAWGDATGATDAGITMLGDADSSFSKALGLTFSVPDLGFFDRSQRYSMLVEDGKVTIFNPEPPNGQCEISAGQTLLAQLD